ncbi:hypothetical protein [Brucella tritici]|uniref:Uncharacterized protein n=1 Tax=Brucella tritici TaxID=94626 RepID=A0A6L3YDW5_9HYPH|nr:hypothetical protein [Brucella tritici]KAB2678435.1 hypothetical protein F9L08_23750 [Brucella tritici]
MSTDLQGTNGDVVPMMPWSGLSQASVEQANEMGTSELPLWQHDGATAIVTLCLTGMARYRSLDMIV